jgi:anti-sigma B factor antagonist
MKLTRRRRRPATPQPGPTRPFSAVAAPTDYGLLVTVTGELDIATAPQLREALTARPAEDGLMVVDLTPLTFMDSTGLSEIVRTANAVEAARRRFAVVCPPGPARLLFEVTGLDEQLPLYDTLEAATASP